MSARKLAFLILLLFGCGGSLTDEQRREMKKRMEENQIVRVTEVEITEAAYEEGRRIVRTLDSLKDQSDELDAFVNRQPGKIRFLTPETADPHPLQRVLIEAYIGDQSGSLQDNVQKLRNNSGDFDSLLYTKPVIRKLPDGETALEGVWNIWLSRKELVMHITRQK